MKYDKKINLNEVVKQAINEASKQTGILSEQDTSTKPKFVYKEFDPEESLKKVQLKPQKWGKKSTFEARHIDVLLSNLGVSGGDGLSSVRTLLQNLNKHLGVKIGEYGLPVFDETAESPSNLSEIVSSLQVKDILHSIIYEQESSAAGTIIEGLMARVVSGEQSSIVKRPIQDIVDGKGNYISLKVLDESSEFRGSKLNLAKGINEKGFITYLLFIKSSKDNPFKIKVHSFKINKNNYFPFILNRYASELTAANIYHVAKGLLGEKFNSNHELLTDIIDGEKLPTKSLEKEKKASVNFDKLEPEIIDQAIKQISSIKGIDTDFRKDFHTTLINIYKQLLEKFNELDTENKETAQDLSASRLFIQKHFSMLDPNNSDNILTSIPSNTTGKKALFTKKFQLAIDQTRELGAASKEDKIKFFEPDEQKKEIVKKYQSDPDSLSDQEAKIYSDMTNDFDIYEKRYRTTYRKIQNIVTFLSKLEKEVRQILSGKQSGISNNYNYRPEESNKTQNIIDAFFDMVKTENIDPYVGIKGATEQTQFKHRSLNSMFAIASSFADSEYDDSYPEFILEKKWLFSSKKENVKLLRELITPIYEGGHKIDSGVEQYFIYDEIEGLELIKSGAEQSKAAAQKQQTTYGDIKPSKITKLQENTKKPLTKHWTEIMLEELMTK